ncbi:MAG: hypothetical protein JWP48_5537 [Actinoallomurus sp.]|nr:hypothetical protein [Actinoallomurus sp.]
MIVPVVAVGRVAMTVVHVVGVVIVRNGDMATVRAVSVVVPVMDDVLVGPAFVAMPVVVPVHVAVMGVIDVIVVREGHMTTARPVVMWVIRMRVVRRHGSHSRLLKAQGLVPRR